MSNYSYENKLSYLKYVKSYLDIDEVTRVRYQADAAFKLYDLTSSNGDNITVPLIIYNHFLKGETLKQWISGEAIEIYNGSGKRIFSGRWNFKSKRPIYSKNYNYPSSVTSSKSSLSWIYKNYSIKKIVTVSGRQVVISCNEFEKLIDNGVFFKDDSAYVKKIVAEKESFDFVELHPEFTI